MRVRTIVGILVALATVVAVSYLSHHNVDLLTRLFVLTPRASVPLYWVVVAVFLLGFLPTGGALLVQTLRRDLARRRERRSDREARSRRGSFRRAIDLEADGQWGRAASEYEALLSDQPEDFGALLRYGEVLRRLGRPDEAVEVHRRASVLYPQSVAVLFELAEDYEARGEPEVGEQIRDRVLRDYQGVGLSVLRRRRNARMEDADWKTAARLQERIDAMAQEAGGGVEEGREEGIRRGLDYQHGVELLGEERLDEARTTFEGLLAREPGFLPASIMLGEVALLADDPAGAVAEWRRGFEATGSPVFLQRIEDHFIEKEQPLEAIEMLRELIGATDNDLLPRFYLGRLYYRLEMHDEALKTLRPLGERIHSSPTFHLLLARIRERRGEVGKAVESYLACIQEAGIATGEYACRVCDARHDAWIDRCDRCGSWNSVDLDFEEEKLTPEELGVRPGPVWSVADDDAGR